MLSAQENETLTRVGPGTPMGDLMREYWIPALLSSELPTPDGPPMRMRLLEELGREVSRSYSLTYMPRRTRNRAPRAIA